jgi:hypothetical protein
MHLQAQVEQDITGHLMEAITAAVAAADQDTLDGHLQELELEELEEGVTVVVDQVIQEDIMEQQILEAAVAAVVETHIVIMDQEETE